MSRLCSGCGRAINKCRFVDSRGDLRTIPVATQHYLLSTLSVALSLSPQIAFSLAKKKKAQFAADDLEERTGKT